MTLEEVYRIVLDRKLSPREGSYVSSLLAGGKDAVLKKIGEESSEVIIAAKGGGRPEIIHEIADLWFHSLVLMAAEGITPEEIFEEFEKRHRERSE